MNSDSEPPVAQQWGGRGQSGLAQTSRNGLSNLRWAARARTRYACWAARSCALGIS